MLKGYTKEEKSWMMYDWANSAHSVIVVTLDVYKRQAFPPWKRPTKC